MGGVPGRDWTCCALAAEETYRQRYVVQELPGDFVRAAIASTTLASLFALLWVAEASEEHTPQPPLALPCGGFIVRGWDRAALARQLPRRCWALAIQRVFAESEFTIVSRRSGADVCVQWVRK